MALLGLDIGTTHCKAGLFEKNGQAIALASRATPNRQSEDGRTIYDPIELWETAAGTAREAYSHAAGRPVEAIGVASMAETGLFVERATGAPQTEMIPWFDREAEPQAERLASGGDPFERFIQTGMPAPTYKCSLAKILWLVEHRRVDLAGWVWLSAADWIALRLSGGYGTDYSLACRTGAFRFDQLEWDAVWLERFHLPASLFPPVRLAGTPVGELQVEAAEALGLPVGIPVAVTGHDHVCAAFAAGVTEPGQAFDSMGTAEALTGAVRRATLGEPEYRSGLSYGCHTAAGMNYWMGGLSTSGGSLDWLRSILADPPLDYAALAALIDRLPEQPGRVVFFPYLAGSGSPHSDPQVRGAFVGLASGHTRLDLLQAVLEGTAYEVETIRQVAQAATGLNLSTLRAAGGGARLSRWVQIKADVSGCVYEALDMPETTLLGAALLAGVGGGVYPDQGAALATLGDLPACVYRPEPRRHTIYQALFQRGYLAFQAPLRRLSGGLDA